MSRKFKTYSTTLLTIFIILMAFMPTGQAVAAMTGVDVTRIINGSTEFSGQTPGYKAGDCFVVELSYAVTGTQYAVRISEELPDGWNVLDSDRDYTYDIITNTVTWTTTNLYSGVRSGKIHYMVQIPAATAEGTYDIDGYARWCDSYVDIATLESSGTRDTDISGINVIPSGSPDGNGPFVWISDIEEETGDGDGHLENGETASYNFAIIDKSGIGSFDIKINGVSCNSYASDSHNNGTMIMGDGTAAVTIQANQANVFTIEASDINGHESTYSTTVFVPYYDCNLWTEAETDGAAVKTAWAGHTSSYDSGNWIFPEGGNNFALPATEFEYYGPTEINKAASAIALFGGVPILGEMVYILTCFTNDDVTFITNATIPTDIVMPYDSYPIYSEYDGMDEATFTFRGDSSMCSECFDVYLIDLSLLLDDAGASDLGAIMNSMSGATIPDIMDAAISHTIKQADANGDFTVTGSDIDELDMLDYGYYAILIVDPSLPDTPCIVSMAPIIVTKNGLSSDLQDENAMPGDSLTFYETLQGETDSATYMYMVMMVPVDDYNISIDIDTDGTAEGTTTQFDGLSLSETITQSQDGAMHITGNAIDVTLTPADLSNMTLMEELFIEEFGASNIAFGSAQTTQTEYVEIQVPTREYQPHGEYMVISMAINMNNGKIAAVNQSTAHLGIATYFFDLYEGWNLISVPLDVEDNSINGIFPQSARNNIVVIRQYDPNSNDPWAYYTPRTDIYDQGTLTAINEKAGYWVLCDCNVTFNINGVPHADSTVTLNNGWTLAGNPTMETRNVQNVYGSNDIVVVWQYDSTGEDAWTYYTPRIAEYDQGTLTTLKPGFGYWILKSL